MSLSSPIYAKNVLNTCDAQKMNNAANYKDLITVQPGDSLAEVVKTIGTEVRRRELASPTNDGGSMLVLDFMIQDGHYENVLLGDDRVVTTPALTLIVEGDTIKRLIGNPNRPDQPDRSTLRGVPRDSREVHVKVQASDDMRDQ